jgi:membrane dipeptidase
MSIDNTPPPPWRRRRWLQATLALAGTPVLAQQPAATQHTMPVADLHSHFGMFTRQLGSSGLAEQLRAQRVALLAWAGVPDSRWLRTTATGIEQAGEPQPGQLAARCAALLQSMREYLAAHGLKPVLGPADVDAALAGPEPGVVLASEGADFLEGRIEGLDTAFALGLRHLQLVHYIRNPVGDFQTAAPSHEGLSEFGRQIVSACNHKGVLVDLAHSTGASIDQALAMSQAPMVWSHGWVGFWNGDWRAAYGFQRRRLSTAYARKIAERGGVVGLWALGLNNPADGWSVARGDKLAYARELVALVDKIGADHVALGTDIEGLGPGWAVNDYGHVREVIDHLQALNVPASVIERVAYRNHARVLKAALKG